MWSGSHESYAVCLRATRWLAPTVAAAELRFVEDFPLRAGLRPATLPLGARVVATVTLRESAANPSTVRASMTAGQDAFTSSTARGATL